MKRHARTRRAAWLVALSLALTVLVVPPASAATLSASLTPSSANAGAQTTFTLTVTSQVRSLSLAAPSGFFVGSATSSRGNANVSGNQTVSVTGINGSQPVIVTITAWPNCTPGSATWTLNATGNPSTTYDPATLPTTVNTSSSCKLVFQHINDQRTGASFDVKVDVKRANDTIDPTYTNPISLSIETDPGNDDNPNLTSNSPRTPSGGTATFSAALAVAGTGYVLEACSSPITGTPCGVLEDDAGFISNLFAVYDDVQPCHAGNSCSAHASAPGQVSTQVSANGQEGNSVKAGIFGVPQATPGSTDLSNLDCAGYDEITEVIASFAFDGSGIKTVTNTVSAEQMKEIANQGVSFLQVCFGSSLPFKDRFNQDAVFNDTLGLWVGLLKDCPSNKKNLANSAPCVVSRQGGGTGTGTITYVAADKDPGGSRH
jgi:hypothetical protein